MEQNVASVLYYYQLYQIYLNVLHVAVHLVSDTTR